MAKKTRWFPCSIKPVRNGWFEVELNGIPPADMCFFSGGRWRYFLHGYKATGVDRPGYDNGDRWRGLAK